MASWLPILTFHDIDDRHSVTSVTPEVFRSGMMKLFENGYRTLSLPETANYLKPNASFPDRSFVITFDDGFQSAYEEAFPVLQRYEMSATVFLTVGEKTAVKVCDRLPSMENRPMLTWGEVREMHRWGINFGAHTLTHPDLTDLPSDRIEAELSNSKAVIEDALSAPVTCFAYPYGRFDAHSREIVRKYFACACSDKLGLVTANSNPYVLERVDAYYLRTDRLFALMVTELFPWYVRARSLPRRIRRNVQRSLRK
jgi:peptidoglycan/xylan/chitin deacetylase (PgdA/CDA1 family)